ncbi:MAG: TIGR00266 family protein [Deltaproteobacteria bacterium]|nr:TIGR00266 family protein [Deltaproteobacteria bacterium]TLN02299.1 MAG: TIGR00266 family protein [bacterium]
MSNFSVTCGTDPFLKVSLKPGESIFAVSKAMVTMSPSLSLKGGLKGGLFSSLLRKGAQGVSAFLQIVEAPVSAGEALLSPTLPGDIFLVELEPGQELFINDGCFLAASASIQLLTNIQSPNKAVFGGTGGFVIMKATGPGTVALSGFGSMQMIEMTTEEQIVDHSHIVAWDGGLNYQVTTLSSGGSFLKGLFRGTTSGEGFINSFSGTGNIYLCSRNRDDLLAWVFGQMPKREKRPVTKKKGSIWSRSYFCATTGTVSAEVIRQYIESQWSKIA